MKEWFIKYSMRQRIWDLACDWLSVDTRDQGSLSVQQSTGLQTGFGQQSTPIDEYRRENAQ